MKSAIVRGLLLLAALAVFSTPSSAMEFGKTTVLGRALIQYTELILRQGVDIEKLEKELELTILHPDFEGYLRFTNDNPFPETIEPNRLEKAALSFSKGATDVTLGSFSETFGRGLTLNVFEERSLDHDNMLDGARIRTSWKNWDTTVLGGMRKVRTKGPNFVFGGPTTKIIKPKIEAFDGSDLVYAARGAYSGFDNWTIGGNVVFSDEESFYPVEPYLAHKISTGKNQVTGIDVEFARDWFAFYAEGALMNRDDNNEISDDGHGWMVSMDFLGNRKSLNIGYKDYENMGFDYNQPAVFKGNPEWAQCNANDERGWYVEGLMNPWKMNESTFKARAAWSARHDGDADYREYFLEYRHKPEAETSWGLAWDYAHEAELMEREIKYIGDFTHHFNGDWGWYALYQHSAVANFGEAFTDKLLQTSLNMGPKYTLFLSHEETGYEYSEFEEWNNMEVTWRPNQDHELKVFYGSRRGGFQCANGVCVLVSDFKGLEATYTWNF